MTAAVREKPISTMPASETGDPSLEQLLTALRPKLHRYCARITGSVIDGEDVVQEALLKAVAAWRAAPHIDRPEAWLFRIAHNAALDFLRRRAHREVLLSDEALDMVADPVNRAEERLAAAASLRTFMQLPVAQRSSVVLMDVLGYSLEEVGAVLGATIPAVKASLHRGRGRLRALAEQPDDRPVPALPEAQRALLAAYVERFNARDFDAIRDMLAEEVRLDLVANTRMNGRKEVGTYLHNYERNRDWRFTLGLVEGRLAALVSDVATGKPGPSYFILLEWLDGKLAFIRDFRYARYAIEGADIAVLGPE
jgi:RNA polymerase sigma-70 factor (ECF subfamily)